MLNAQGDMLDQSHDRVGERRPVRPGLQALVHHTELLRALIEPHRDAVLALAIAISIDAMERDDV